MRSAAKYIWIAVAVFFVGGFLLLDTSGLLGAGSGGVTNATTVAKVNGRTIPYQTYYAATQNLAQQEEQQRARALTLDERRQIDSVAFEQLVSDILLQQEIARRGITVSDEEIIQAAQFNPPPQLLQSPELLTEGRFDPEKYRRFLQSPSAKQTGLLAQLEQYYRGEIPRQKLFAQVAADVYVTDERLWQIYRDGNDSAQVSAVVLRPDQIPDSAVAITDQEVRAYFEKNKANFERPGRATISVITIPRTVTAADSAAIRARAATLRAEIAGGAKFEDVARRESSDSNSAANGGSLGNYVRGQGFVKEFEDAAYALQPGQVSEPVLSPFGYHLIRVDEKKGDTLALRHILLPIAQSDTTATLTDRRADELLRLAGSSEDPKQFDAAAKQLGLPIRRGVVLEGGRLIIDNQYVPSAAAWAFDGATTGQTSELFDSPDGYFLARLDSLVPGGEPRLEGVAAEIRGYLAKEKKLDRLVQQGTQLAARAKAGTLEAAAQAAGLQVQQTQLFTRVNAVPLLGQFNEAIGAAFALPVGAVSAPVRTADGVYVMRVDRRTEAARQAFEAQKAEQRRQITGALRNERVRDFIDDLRKSAEIDDRRREVLASGRQQAAG
jgi:peptidyl-prolyl cis-trans isomerase D